MHIINTKYPSKYFILLGLLFLGVPSIYALIYLEEQNIGFFLLLLWVFVIGNLELYLRIQKNTDNRFKFLVHFSMKKNQQQLVNINQIIVNELNKIDNRKEVKSLLSQNEQLIHQTELIKNTTDEQHGNFGELLSRNSRIEKQQGQKFQQLIHQTELIKNTTDQQHQELIKFSTQEKSWRGPLEGISKKLSQTDQLHQGQNELLKILEQVAQLLEDQTAESIQLDAKITAIEAGVDRLRQENEKPLNLSAVTDQIIDLKEALPRLTRFPVLKQKLEEIQALNQDDQRAVEDIRDRIEQLGARIHKPVDLRFIERRLGHIEVFMGDRKELEGIREQIENVSDRLPQDMSFEGVAKRSDIYELEQQQKESFEFVVGLFDRIAEPFLNTQNHFELVAEEFLSVLRNEGVGQKKMEQLTLKIKEMREENELFQLHVIEALGVLDQDQQKNKD